MSLQIFAGQHWSNNQKSLMAEDDQINPKLDVWWCKSGWNAIIIHPVKGQEVKWTNVKIEYVLPAGADELSASVSSSLMYRWFCYYA